MSLQLLYSLIGFGLAAYAVIANDVIQTLGTFLSSNSKKHWVILWAYAATILSVTLVIGWVLNDGDVTYGRLSKIPLPENIAWWFLVPPLLLLILTHFGLPVSTTFMILSIFSTGQIIEKMVIKSVLGYAVAFLFAFVVYLLIARKFESKSALDKIQLKNQKRFWLIAQWFSTGFLWSQWLIQDFANIYVYLPRKLDLTWLLISMAFILHLFIIAPRTYRIRYYSNMVLLRKNKKGKIQNPNQTKIADDSFDWETLGGRSLARIIRDFGGEKEVMSFICGVLGSRKRVGSTDRCPHKTKHPIFDDDDDSSSPTLHVLCSTALTTGKVPVS